MRARHEVVDLAMHRELRRLGLITRDDSFTSNDKATAMIRSIDRFNAPMIAALDRFLPPRRGRPDNDRGSA